MSRGLRRTDRPIQTARIDPEVIRRRTVRAERLRIAAVSPTVRSGSRRETRPAATLCLLSVDFHRELTQAAQVFPPRTDPCSNLTPLAWPGGDGVIDMELLSVIRRWHFRD